MNGLRVENFHVRNEILLVLDSEDGPLIRRTLEAAGYPVLTAETTNQADDLFRSFGAAIRLLIVDIGEKDRSQLEFIAALRKTHPALRVLVASTDASHGQWRNIYLPGVIERIRHPVDKEQLLQAVRRTVER